MHVALARFTQIAPPISKHGTPEDLAKGEARLYTERLSTRVCEAVSVAIPAVEECLARAEYEALKIVAWSERRGSHIVGYVPKAGGGKEDSSSSPSSESLRDAAPVAVMSDIDVFKAVTTESRHVIYVSDQEVIGYDATAKCRIVLTWLQFLLVCPSFRVLSRPRPDNVHAVVDRARLANSPDTSTNGFDTDLHWAYYCENGKTDVKRVVPAGPEGRCIDSLRIHQGFELAWRSHRGWCRSVLSHCTVLLSGLHTVGHNNDNSGSVLGDLDCSDGMDNDGLHLLLENDDRYRKKEGGCLPFMIINDTDFDVKCYTYYASDTVQFISLSSHDCAQWGMLELACRDHADLKAFRLGVARAGGHDSSRARFSVAASTVSSTSPAMLSRKLSTTSGSCRSAPFPPIAPFESASPELEAASVYLAEYFCGRASLPWFERFLSSGSCWVKDQRALSLDTRDDL
ncbi:hypothetical protein FOZ60_006973 [Perkinsus olseni]|uniref:Uncharacterized protein n=1 Tax=Perkinsus olseni TaxID=32597 RepID=A0A7J6PF48_PEROL|nr:hypothetical protein FOZ60_006973 [Perkinsus olseni]